MDDIKDLIKDTKSLLNSFYKEEESNQKRISNQDELRQEVSSFIANQMQSINNQSVLQDLITKELIDKIILHELSTEELRGLYTDISNSKSKHTSALLDMFKPTQQSNALMTNPTNESQNESIGLSSEQRNSFDKLVRVLEVINSKKKGEY